MQIEREVNHFIKKQACLFDVMVLFLNSSFVWKAEWHFLNKERRKNKEKKSNFTVKILLWTGQGIPGQNNSQKGL